MKAVQVLAPGRAEFVEVPRPDLRPEHALIRPVCLSLCASDVYMLRHAPLDSYPFPPGSSGHEMIGVVEAVTASDVPFRVGDLALTIAPDQCAMAEYYLAPVQNVLPLPPAVPVTHLVQAQQIGTVLYACKQLPNMIGKDVAVIGQGSAGLWFDAILSRQGAQRIIAIDLQTYRLAVSKRYGATHTIHNAVVEPETALRHFLGGALPEVVIVAAGEVDAINLGIELTGEHGLMLQFGVPHAETFSLHYGELFRKCLSVKAIVHASREPGHMSTRAALELIATGAIDVGTVLTHRFPFARVLEAYELQAARDEGNIKIIIDMPDGR